MMAAATASENKNNEVILIEKNEKLGKKLFITGKGRCNLTNACDSEGFFNNVITNPKFLYSAFNDFDNNSVMDFFDKHGLRLKTERGARVFPMSDHSSDVIKTLEKVIKENGVGIRLNTRAETVIVKEGQVKGILTKTGEKMPADRVILALGGVSYPGCGASDDAFRIAENLDIKVSKEEPALVPLVIREDICKRLQGLSLKNVSAELVYNNKSVYHGFGEMLFTHYGVSGPLILSASSYIKNGMYEGDLKLHIDTKSALTEKQLDDRVLRDFSENLNRKFSNSLNALLPSKLIPVIIELSKIDPEKKVNEITREERNKFVKLLKDIVLTVEGNRGFLEAIVTRGGINVKEINPSTMESKKIKGLFFAGEMIDVDALTGGFNLQIAWSTGHLAGESATGS